MFSSFSKTISIYSKKIKTRHSMQFYNHTSLLSVLNLHNLIKSTEYYNKMPILKCPNIVDIALMLVVMFTQISG